MTSLFYIVPISLGIVWVYFVISNYVILKRIRKNKEYKDCLNYQEIKNIGTSSNNEKINKLYLEVKKSRQRLLTIWFSSIILAVLVI